MIAGAMTRWDALCGGVPPKPPDGGPPPGEDEKCCLKTGTMRKSKTVTCVLPGIPRVRGISFWRFAAYESGISMARRECLYCLGFHFSQRYKPPPIGTYCRYTVTAEGPSFTMVDCDKFPQAVRPGEKVGTLTVRESVVCPQRGIVYVQTGVSSIPCDKTFQNIVSESVEWLYEYMHCPQRYGPSRPGNPPIE